MRDWLERTGVAALRLLSRLPYPVLRHVGNAGGRLAWWIAGQRRHIAMVNLRLCFPQWTEAQRQDVARAHFRYVVRSFIERFIFWYDTPERIQALCRIEGLEYLEPHVGKPLILLAPHFVGLDAGGTRLQIRWPGASIYARQGSRVLTEVMTRGRSRFHPEKSTMLLRTDGVRAVLRPLRAGISLYFLPDMDLGTRDAVFVPFFGVPAATVTSVSRLAKLARATVLPVVTTMHDDGYVVKVYPPWKDFPGDDPVDDARRMNAFIEQRVLEAPAQYLWTHKRFKTRPPGEADVYRPAR